MSEFKKINSFVKQFQESDTKLRLYQSTEALIHIEPGDISAISVTEEYGESLEDNVDIKTEEPSHDESEMYDEDYKPEVDFDEVKVKHKCETCDKVFKSKKVLMRHLQSHEGDEHACSECGKKFSQKTHLKVHMRSHFTDEEKPFKCDHCGLQYAYQYQLTQHSYKHTDEKPFPCPQCDKGCITADSLKRHMRIHNASYEKKKHTCHVCNKEFLYPSFLAEHMKNHTGEKPFLCSYCGKGFRQKGALQYHIRIHTGNKPFSCEICKSTFMSQGKY